MMVGTRLHATNLMFKIYARPAFTLLYYTYTYSRFIDTTPYA